MALYLERPAAVSSLGLFPCWGKEWGQGAVHWSGTGGRLWTHQALTPAEGAEVQVKVEATLECSGGGWGKGSCPEVCLGWLLECSRPQHGKGLCHPVWGPQPYWSSHRLSRPVLVLPDRMAYFLKK